jgi:hypothetical protein
MGRPEVWNSRQHPPGVSTAMGIARFFGGPAAITVAVAVAWLAQVIV